jgi:hypothetical protein
MSFAAAADSMAFRHRVGNVVEFRVEKDVLAGFADELDDSRAHVREELAPDLEDIHYAGKMADDRRGSLVAVDVQRHDELGIRWGAC